MLGCEVVLIPAAMMKTGLSRHRDPKLCKSVEVRSMLAQRGNLVWAAPVSGATGPLLWLVARRPQKQAPSAKVTARLTN